MNRRLARTLSSSSTSTILSNRLLARSTAATATALLAYSIYLHQHPTPASNLGFFSAFSTSAKSNTMSPSDLPKGKSEDEWQATLSKEQFRILRKKGTEMAGTGEYDKHYPGKGVYECAGCSTPLYTADTKFKSGCGWPAFFDAIPGAVKQISDTSFGMTRTELVCSACGGHLGHLFKGEGFDTPTNERACVNSVSIRFNEAGEGKYQGKAKA